MPDEIGVIIGSGIGGIKTFEEQARVFIEKGPGRVSPFFIPMMIPDMGSGYVSIVTGAKGQIIPLLPLVPPLPIPSGIHFGSFKMAMPRR